MEGEKGKWESHKTSLQNNLLNSSNRAKCRLNQRKSKYFVLYMVNYNFFSFLSYSLGANHNNDNILGIYVVR